jgi:hypothetical protein
VAETTKCPFCGWDNELETKECKNVPCHAYLKSELECLRTIDKSLRTIKSIAVWWVVLSVLGAVAYVLIRIGYAI